MKENWNIMNDPNTFFASMAILGAIVGMIYSWVMLILTILGKTENEDGDDLFKFLLLSIGGGAVAGGIVGFIGSALAIPVLPFYLIYLGLNELKLYLNPTKEYRFRDIQRKLRFRIKGQKGCDDLREYINASVGHLEHRPGYLAEDNREYIKHIYMAGGGAYAVFDDNHDEHLIRRLVNEFINT